MRPVTARRVAWRLRLPSAPAVLVWTLGEPIVVGVVVGTAVALASGGEVAFTSFLGVAATFLFVNVGAILVTRLPRHPVGWLLWIGGLLVALTLGAPGLANEGLVLHPGSVPGAIWFAWLGAWGGAPGLFILALFVPLFFPTGRLPSPRWRPVAIVGIAALVAIALAAAFSPFTPGAYPPGVQNPLIVGGALGGALSVMQTAAKVAVGVVVFPAALASVLVRWAGATGIERAQLKWFTAVAVVIIPALVVAALGGGVVAWSIAGAGLTLMPVAIGIAVLRYRLYDIDIVIRRTLVYVPLTALLAGMYTASIGLFQRVFIAVTGNRSDGAVILSTLILATTFTPIKNALQARVDGAFRDAHDAERQLLAFTNAVASSLAKPDPARTLGAFLAVAVEAMGAGGGRAWVQRGASERLVGESPSRSGSPGFEVAVEIDRRRFGRVELDSRRGGRPYTDQDVATLRAAGERLAGALSGFSQASLADRLVPTARSQTASDGVS